ncbi:mCG3755, isoform CRA_b, partial [Mus musculus]
ACFQSVVHLLPKPRPSSRTQIQAEVSWSFPAGQKVQMRGDQKPLHTTSIAEASGIFSCHVLSHQKQLGHL